MNRLRRTTRNDDGVTLVLALIFIVIVSLFTTVALDKAASTASSGGQVRDRGDLQYALDGGVERAWEVLRNDISSATPTLCATVSGTPTQITQEAGGLLLNEHRVDYRCQTLGGRSRTAADVTLTTNFAIVVTGTSSGDFTSSNAVGEALPVSGSIYVAAPVTDANLAKPIEVDPGDIVGYKSTSNCASWDDAGNAGLDNLLLADSSSGYLRACTEQTPAQAYIPVAQPTVSGNAPAPVTVPGGCRVHVPGRYAQAPTIQNNSHNYFVSGVYEINSQQLFVPNTATIIGGRPAAADQAMPTEVSTGNPCVALVSDAAALLAAGVTGVTPAASGVELVFDGNSSFVNRGRMVLFSPPASGSEPAVNIYVTPRGNNNFVADMSDPASTSLLNAKLYSPEASVRFFANGQTHTEARTGIIAQRLDIGAPAGSGLAIYAPGGGSSTPPPPFRTVRVDSQEAGSAATNISVATISNFSPYTVTVLSFRTG